MEKTNFEKLEVYQLAEKLSDRIWVIVRRWDYFARDTVGKQMVRAADSVGANLAEGTGRASPQDHRRFIRMARGSLCETQHWLRRAFRRTLLTKEEIESLKPLVNELSPRLNAYFRSVNTAALKTQRQRTKYKAQSSKN